MKTIYKIYDMKSQQYMSEAFHNIEDAHARDDLLHERVNDCQTVVVQDCIPSERYTIEYMDRRNPFRWIMLHDAATIMEAMERIVFAIDNDRDESIEYIRVIHTGEYAHPMVVLTVKPGEDYPHVEEK